MPNQTYQTAWIAYRDAVASLYAQPVGAMAERGEGDIVAWADLPQRAQTLVDRSQEFGKAVASGLASPVQAQRELAQLHLLAGAAMDLSLANDLVRRAEQGVPAEVVERGALLPSTLSQLQTVLNTPSDAGIQALVEATRVTERGAPTRSDPQAAKAALREAVEGALDDICDDTAAVGQAALVALGQLPMPPIQQAASAILGEVLTKLGEGVSALVSKAVGLVVQAVDKILAAFGKDAQDQARQQAAKWIKDLQGGTLFGVLLKKLYEPERIQNEIDQLLSQAGVGTTADVFNKVSQQVAELSAKFRMQKKVLAMVIHGLNFARPWILILQPWGPLGITAAYLVGIGYIVYAGGDYIDWYRTGPGERLSFVPGIRTVVRQSLTDTGA